MKQKINFLILFLCIAFCFFLVACNSSGKSDNEDSGDNNEAITEWDGLGELATKDKYDLRVKTDSSAIAGLESNLLDYSTNNSSVWFSGVGTSSAGEHYLILDLGGVYNIHKVGLTPYLFTETDEATGEETQLEEVSCFPKDIAVSYCIEDGKYTTAYSLNDYTPDYSVKVNENGTKYATDQEFGFGGYVTARYVKVTFSEMSDDGLGNYLVKICSAKLYVTEADELDEAKRVYEESLMPTPYDGFNISASSVNDADPTAPFTIEALSDGNYGSYWCAEWLNETSPETDEYIDISSADGSVVSFTQVILVALPENESLPVDFEIQYQIDGAGFVTAQKYTNYVNPRGALDNYNVFTFDAPICADTIRFQFTKKSLSKGGFYVVMMGEVMAKANVATAAEIEAATAAYQAALGQSAATEKIQDDKGFLIGILIGSIVLFAAGVVVFVIPGKGKKEGDNEDKQAD